MTYVKIDCRLEVNVIDEGYSGASGLVASHDPETDVITLSGTMTGPVSEIAERFSDVVRTITYRFAKYKVSVNAGEAA